MSRQTLLALTGPSGAGKAVVGELFAAWHIPVLDTDAIYHDLMEHSQELKDELVRAFALEGDALHGGNRGQLRTVIWRNPKKLAKLNALTHRRIHERVLELLTEEPLRNEPLVVLDAPSILDSPVDWQCEKIISVLAPREARIARICARDGLTKEDAEARVNGQRPDAFYAAHSDLVLHNDAPNVEDAKRALAEPLRNALTAWGLFPGQSHG